MTATDPLRVLIVGGGLAGLVTAAACHAKGMKVAIFEQASSYAPYGGPIQIQSNALRAIQRISRPVYEELVAAGTVTADRVRKSQGEEAPSSPWPHFGACVRADFVARACRRRRCPEREGGGDVVSGRTRCRG